MRLITKGRFAVTAMVDLAMQRGSGPVTLAEIRQRQKISLSYLEQLFSKLRRCALVDSVRGPGVGRAYAMDDKLPADCIRLAAAREETAGLGAMFGTVGAERVAAQQKVTV